MASKESEVSVGNRGINFVRDAWNELKKVHSPSRQETKQATLVVFVMICAFAVILGLIDVVWGFVIQRLIAG